MMCVYISVEVAVIQHDAEAHRPRDVPCLSGQTGRKTASVGTVPPLSMTRERAVSAGATIAWG